MLRRLPHSAVVPPFGRRTALRSMRGFGVAAESSRQGDGGGPVTGSNLRCQEFSQSRGIKDGTTMARRTTKTYAKNRQRDLELTTARAGVLVAMSDVVRYTRGGLRTVVRRTGRVAAALSRQPRAAALRPGPRVTIAPRLHRAEVRIARRQPVEYVAAGVVAGAIGTVTFAALTWAVLGGADDGSGASSDDAPAGSRDPYRARSARAAIDRIVPRRSLAGPRLLAVPRPTEQAPEATPTTTTDAPLTPVSALRGHGGHGRNPSGTRTL
jgi:hypothetical protein